MRKGNVAQKRLRSEKAPVKGNQTGGIQSIKAGGADQMKRSDRLPIYERSNARTACSDAARKLLNCFTSLTRALKAPDQQHTRAALDGRRGGRVAMSVPKGNVYNGKNWCGVLRCSEAGDTNNLRAILGGASLAIG